MRIANWGVPLTPGEKWLLLSHWVSSPQSGPDDHETQLTLRHVIASSGTSLGGEHDCSHELLLRSYRARRSPCRAGR